MQNRWLRHGLMIALLQLAVAVPTHADNRYAGTVAGGHLTAEGLTDYLQLLNLRDGGINGARLRRKTCESGLGAHRDVVCFKFAGSRRAAILLPLSNENAAGWIERSRAGRIPLLIPADERSDATDGRVFPFVFRLTAGRLSQATAVIRFIGVSEGGIEHLRGKRLAFVYRDDTGGREVLEMLGLLAGERGLTLTRHAIENSRTDQLEIWRGVRETSPDWVLLAVPGPMTAVALKAAASIGLPANRIIGLGSSGAEQDIVPAGPAAVGFIAVAGNPSGANYAVVRDIRRHVHAKRNGVLAPEHLGNVHYLRGVSLGLLIAEATRQAQRRFGAGAPDGEQLRWGLERLQLDEERLDQLGALELLPLLSTSCLDHDGSGAVKFQQWLGTRWNVVSDWISGDQALVRLLVDTAARRYLAMQRKEPRDCTSE